MSEVSAGTLTSKGSLVLLYGEAGIGKTRIIRELTERLVHTRFHLAAGAAYPNGHGHALAALADTFRSAKRQEQDKLGPPAVCNAATRAHKTPASWRIPPGKKCGRRGCGGWADP